MTRYSFGFICVLALGVMGCSETAGTGGSAGDGGSGGDGGTGGNGVACVDSVCPCTEAGIRAAIAEGGGPFTFDCDGPTTVVTEAEIVIDNDVILHGEGKLTVDGNLDHRVFYVRPSFASELDGFSITRGRAVGECDALGRFAGIGGAIYTLGTLSLSNSQVTGNTNDCESAGSIVGRAVTVANSTVSGNEGGVDSNGTIIDSTVSDNSGVAIRGASVMNTTVSGNQFGLLLAPAVANSTVSGNDVGFWGVVDSIITNSTVVGNADNFREVCCGTVRGSIFDSCDLFDGRVHLTSLGYNILPCDTDEAHPTDQVNVSADDLKLGPLQDNGGPTMTHALGAGSVAIDQIPAVDCEVTEDQRGVARPQGPACDVGAFELEVAP